VPEVANLQVVVTADTSAAERGLTDLGSKVSGAGSAMAGALGAGAVAAGAAVAAGLAVGVKSAGDLQQSIANISTIKPDIDTSAAFAALNEMSTRIPATASELGDSLYNVFSSMDVGADKALLLVETFAKGAAGAGTTAETFGTAAMGVMNAYGLAASDAAAVSDMFFDTINKGVVTGDELAASLGPVTQAAKAAGVEWRDLGPMIAAVTKEGGPAAQNMNNLSNLFGKFTTTAAQGAMHDLGIATTDAEGKFRKVPDVLADLKVALGDLTDVEAAAALQKIFPDVQARQGAQVIMSQIDFVNDALKSNQEASGSTAAAYEKMSATFNSQSQLLMNNLMAIGTAIGAEVLPHLTPLIAAFSQALPAAFQVAKDAVETFKQVMAGDWSPAENIHPVTLAVGELAVAFRDTLWPAIQTVATFVSGTLVPAIQSVGGFLAEHPELIAGVAAAFASLVVISTVAGWITSLVAAFSAIAGAMTSVGAVVGIIVAALGGPLTVAILAVAAVIGVLTAAWIGNWGDIQGKTAAAVAAITPIIQNMLTAIQGFWTAHGAQIMTIVTAVWTIITTQIETAFTVISGIVTAALQLLSGDWEAAWTTITATAQAVWDSWGVVLQAALDILVALFEPAFTAIAAAWTAFTTSVAAIWQAGWDAVMAILTAAWNLLSTENQTRITELIALTTQLWTTLGELWTAGTTAVGLAVSLWWAQLVTDWTAYQTAVSDLVGPWWTTIQGLWDTALAAIGTALSTAWTTIVTATGTFFTDLGAKFTEASTSLGQQATELGSAIMTSLIDAVNAKVGDMLKAVTGAVSGALSAARSLLGGAGGSSGGSSDPKEYLKQAALARGIDPDQVAKVMMKEGPGGWDDVGTFPTGTSYGPLQLHYAGGSDPQAGMGDRFTKQTGIDLRNDRSLQAHQKAIDFALDELLKAGNYGEWYGADKALGSRHTAVARVPAQVIASQRAAMEQLNQFDMTGGTLSAAEAAVFCGPAAAMWFAGTYGRMPSKAEAEDMARQVGWKEGQGMLGPGSQQRLNELMGVPTNVDYNPTAAKVGELAAAGTPFQLSTRDHYYQVAGGTLDALNVGGSGIAGGGSATMSLAQIIELSGAMNGIITLAPQMGQALATSAATGGAALDTLLLSTTTMADGSTLAITQMGADVTATITDATGQVTSQYGVMAEGVATQTATMAATAMTSVTDLGGAMMTTTTDAAGSVVTTVATMGGQVTSQYATLANGVTLTMGDMANGVMTSTTDMGTGVMTTVQDTAGNYLTTITDLQGNVTSQYTTLAANATTATAEMASGVAAEVTTMASDSLTSVTDMGEGTLTITQNAAGEMIAQIVDMAGNVTSSYTTMGNDTTAAAGVMAADTLEAVSGMISDVESSMSELDTIAADAAEALSGIGEVDIPAPDVSEVIESMGDIEEAAREAARAVENAGSGDGDGGGDDDDDDDDDDDERARGGPVRAGHQYLVGEQGPELFVPDVGGRIVPRHALMSSGGESYGGGAGGGSVETVRVEIAVGGRVAEEIYVTGRALAIRRGRVSSEVG
jgi:TP901 family phage tail tape measure protein